MKQISFIFPFLLIIVFHQVFPMDYSHLPQPDDSTEISNIMWPYQIATRLYLKEGETDSPSSLYILPRPNAPEEIQPILGEIPHHNQYQAKSIVTSTLSHLIAIGCKKIIMPEKAYNRLLNIFLDGGDAHTLFILSLPCKKENHIATVTLPDNIPAELTFDKLHAPPPSPDDEQNKFEQGSSRLKKSPTLVNLVQELEKLISSEKKEDAS